MIVCCNDVILVSSWYDVLNKFDPYCTCVVVSMDDNVGGVNNKLTVSKYSIKNYLIERAHSHPILFLMISNFDSILMEISTPTTPL